MKLMPLTIILKGKVSSFLNLYEKLSSFPFAKKLILSGFVSFAASPKTTSTFEMVLLFSWKLNLNAVFIFVVIYPVDGFVLTTPN